MSEAPIVNTQESSIDTEENVVKGRLQTTLIAKLRYFQRQDGFP